MGVICRARGVAEAVGLRKNAALCVVRKMRRVPSGIGPRQQVPACIPRHRERVAAGVHERGRMTRRVIGVGRHAAHAIGVREHLAGGVVRVPASRAVRIVDLGQPACRVVNIGRQRCAGRVGHSNDLAERVVRDVETRAIRIGERDHVAARVVLHRLRVAEGIGLREHSSDGVECGPGRDRGGVGDLVGAHDVAEVVEVQDGRHPARGVCQNLLLPLDIVRDRSLVAESVGDRDDASRRVVLGRLQRLGRPRCCQQIVIGVVCVRRRSAVCVDRRHQIAGGVVGVSKRLSGRPGHDRDPAVRVTRVGDRPAA